MVSALQELLKDLIIERSKLNYMLLDHKKKDGLNAFAHSVTTMIEKGKAAIWISTVTKEDLVSHGQDINCLFQLLVEDLGKHETIPLVDLTTLERAAQHTDLFSPK